MYHSPFNTRRTLSMSNGLQLAYHSLPALEQSGFSQVSSLPVSLRIILEALLRHCDGLRILPEHVTALANWQATEERTSEIPFVVARVILQDFTGVPLLADLAAMRSVAHAAGRDPKLIEPQVPVDLVVDHSVMVDHFGTPEALNYNMELEYARNHERYQFLKWGMQAFDTFKVIPPGVGIVHQVNLEHLFNGLAVRDGMAFPDTLVGTDSHTTMINAVGVVGWGVGGIEAEAAMLGLPVYFLTPDVVGVELTGSLTPGITATDVVLTLTEFLRAQKVVGQFVEFCGTGSASLSVTDRATIANMAPEYGATMGFFPVDDKTVDYMKKTGRNQQQIEQFEHYFKAQGLFGIPAASSIRYSRTLKLDLSSIVPSLAGPKRPQDRIALSDMQRSFTELFSRPVAENGFGLAEEARLLQHPTGIANMELSHGSILIAAITSCTNTSNPGVMLAAGLLAKKAVERGLMVHPRIKTSLAPGSRVVSAYLERTGLQPYLDHLGFNVVAYGCTTCIGNAGDLRPEFNQTIIEHNLVCAAVLSGNRNFEARIHPHLRANYLASPPLVIAFALAGRVDIDLTEQPLGLDRDGAPVFLTDIWPSSAEIEALLPQAYDPASFRRLYADLTRDLPLWNAIEAPQGQVYDWPTSSYIACPPFFAGFSATPALQSEVRGARALLCLGDSVTTDHISPAGSIGANSPAGEYLLALGVEHQDFNSYGSRRGNHEVMIRGTFANVRLKNLMLPARADGSRIEGGFTLLEGQRSTVYQAAMHYAAQDTPSIVFAGEEYGTGSSRDWAAKGTRLLGVRAVIANSFERIHRSNLVGMGVLPLQFKAGDSWQQLQLKGDETFDILGTSAGIEPQQSLMLVIHAADGHSRQIELLLRIDTPIEVDYFLHGGILPYVLRGILAT